MVKLNIRQQLRATARGCVVIDWSSMPGCEDKFDQDDFNFSEKLKDSWCGVPGCPCGGKPQEDGDIDCNEDEEVSNESKT